MAFFLRRGFDSSPPPLLGISLLLIGTLFHLLSSGLYGTLGSSPRDNWNCFRVERHLGPLPSPSATPGIKESILASSYPCTFSGKRTSSTHRDFYVRVIPLRIHYSSRRKRVATTHTPPQPPPHPPPPPPTPPPSPPTSPPPPEYVSWDCFFSPFFFLFPPILTQCTSSPPPSPRTRTAMTPFFRTFSVPPSAPPISSFFIPKPGAI